MTPEFHPSVAAGLFSIGLVLGWAVLFVAAGWWRGTLTRLAIAATLALLVALSSDPRAAVAGVAAGLLAHLLLQLGLEERRA